MENILYKPSHLRKVTRLKLWDLPKVTWFPSALPSPQLSEDFCSRRRWRRPFLIPRPPVAATAFCTSTFRRLQIRLRLGAQMPFRDKVNRWRATIVWKVTEKYYLWKLFFADVMGNGTLISLNRYLCSYLLPPIPIIGVWAITLLQ